MSSSEGRICSPSFAISAVSRCISGLGILVGHLLGELAGELLEPGLEVFSISRVERFDVAGQLLLLLVVS